MAQAGKLGKNARFYCEECGAEVRPGAAVCPSCGSRFTAIRCPKCGYEGRAPEFRDGCPVCGYGMGLPGKSASARPEPAPAAPPRRTVPVLFYRLAITVLGALVIALALYLVLHG